MNAQRGGMPATRPHKKKATRETNSEEEALEVEREREREKQTRKGARTAFRAPSVFWSCILIRLAFGGLFDSRAAQGAAAASSPRKKTKENKNNDPHIV